MANSDTVTAPAGRPTPVKRDPAKLPFDKIGNFQLRGLLGKGGMGEVFEGFDCELKRKVAIKLLSPAIAQDEEFIDKFLSEAQLAAQIDHQNVCRVYHLGRLPENNAPYIVMEYLAGQNLSQRVKEMGPLPIHQCLKVIKETALALQAAHDKKVLHRDVKPSNIMFTEDGSVKVTDFGLARLLKESAQLSATDHIVGTPHYISPEAGQGKSFDVRSDIYSLGSTFYHLVTGRVPFDGPTPLSVLNSHVHDTPPDPCSLRVGIPRALTAIIQKMMAKEADLRFQDYGELVKAIDELSSLQVEVDASPTVTAKVPRPLLPSALPYLPIVLLVLILAITGWQAVTAFLPINGPQEGKDFVNSLGMKFRWIGPGKFLMGTNGGDKTESPQHEVVFARGFWLSETEVTQEQWKAIRKGDVPTKYVGPKRPVDSVSYDGATTYCRMITLHERKIRTLGPEFTYALPTESQWEYGCRAGTTGAFDLDEVAWYHKSGRNDPADWDLTKWPADQYPKVWLGTRPVRLKKPNPWGLYDMLGNVPEFVRDTWHFGYEKAPADGSAWFNNSSREFIMRGGSYRGRAEYVRPAFRYRPIMNEAFCGFRLAIVDVPKNQYGPSPIYDEASKLSTSTKEGEDFKNSAGMVFRWIKAGSFTMGTPDEEERRNREEGPLHEVTFSEGFWCGAFEVTQEQWRKVMGKDHEASIYRGATRPVQHVSIEEAESFCRTLSSKEAQKGRLPKGYLYRLPTEAQWEYCARAGTTTALYTGPIKYDGFFTSPSLDEIAWYTNSYRTDPNLWSVEVYGPDEYPAIWFGTKPVGLKKPNGWGLYDMLGNVLEWTRDTYYPHYKGAPTDGSARKEVSYRYNVARGGAYSFKANFVRCGSRHAMVYKGGGPLSGLRVFLTKI